jgi:hypothetical protein
MTNERALIALAAILFAKGNPYWTDIHAGYRFAYIGGLRLRLIRPTPQIAAIASSSACLALLTSSLALSRAAMAVAIFFS